MHGADWMGQMGQRERGLEHKRQRCFFPAPGPGSRPAQYADRLAVQVARTGHHKLPVRAMSLLGPALRSCRRVPPPPPQHNRPVASSSDDDDSKGRAPKEKEKKKEKKKNSAPVPLITWPSHLLASRRAAQRNTLPSALLCPALLCPALPCPARLRTFLLRVDARAPCSQQRLSLQIGLGLPSYRPILTSTCRISSSPISGNSIRVPAGHALASDPRPPLSDSPCKSTRPPPAFCQRRAASMAVRTVSGGAIIETHLSSCTAPAAAAVC